MSTEINERKARLVAAIKAAYPDVRVRTMWCSGDWDVSGIEISARHDATGNVLCASRRDDELDAMSEADVMAWARQAMMEFEGRQQSTRRAIRDEREMERE